ncbi:MAG: hypothetical protein D6731_03695 [Planctomycetota bacterium]|nr:MAG: hypothetical protein D6731_03695 [Planctomycetota bacterium]
MDPSAPAPSPPTPRPAGASPRGARRWLRAWGELPRADRFVYALVAGCFALALFAPPAWDRLDPRLPLTQAYREGAALDPWGRPWVERPYDVARGEGGEVYSLGPDGRDEGGRGDDVVLWVGGRGVFVLAVRAHLRGALLACAVLLAAGHELLRLSRRRLSEPRAEELSVELRRAATLALPFLLLSVPLAVGLVRALRGFLRPFEEVLVVPVPAAAGGLAALATFLLLLWVRLRRPAATEDRAAKGREEPPPAPPGSA